MEEVVPGILHSTLTPKAGELGNDEDTRVVFFSVCDVYEKFLIPLLFGISTFKL